MPEALFDIRAACPQDLPALRIISDNVGMPLIESTANTYVAVNGGGEAVGFVRIKVLPDPLDAQGQAHVIYPVAVFETWQGHGVGSALVEHALARHFELRLVACTPSHGFYEKSGFKDAPWDSIPPEVARDCDECPQAGSCTPRPFVKRSSLRPALRPIAGKET
jgi:N-acetylglutamate synthase-like GNAT family acetyltransferase